MYDIEPCTLGLGGIAYSGIMDWWVFLVIVNWNPWESRANDTQNLATAKLSVKNGFSCLGDVPVNKRSTWLMVEMMQMAEKIVPIVQNSEDIEIYRYSNIWTNYDIPRKHWPVVVFQKTA